MREITSPKLEEYAGSEKNCLSLYSLRDPELEVAKRARTLELRRREAIAKLGDRWVGRKQSAMTPTGRGTAEF